MKTRIEFTNEGTFEAMYAAEKWLDARGFSIGPSQVCAPRAIYYGDCYVSKWRGLSAEDKRMMDAMLEGDERNGPVTITLLSTSSIRARAAFAAADEEACSASTGKTASTTDEASK